jgi:RNA polymerase sigma factor (sigma-70 family)
MDKQTADSLIIEYNKKLFGFALSKTCSIQKAEELASRIVLEVYTSLLKRENIANIDGYIYRIAQNVYARYTDEAVKGMQLSLDEAEIPAEHDFTEKIMKSETYMLLRREIAYLSKTQRDIVVLHYFENMKLADIARKLHIPLGTVKWHLYEAKTMMKEGMNTVRNIGSLGINPIEFINMGHSGNPGKMGDTKDFLKKRLTQNIAYAAYHQAKTINEIADELGVSPVFVEDEVAVLEEYGFMDKVEGGKFLTNIYIYEFTKEVLEKENAVYNKYAKLVCEKYVPLVIETLKDYKKDEIYMPDGDMNLLLWSVILYACAYKLSVDKGFDHSAFSVKRKDGGDYIACATLVRDFDVNFNYAKYNTCGNMLRGSGKYPLQAWQMHTYYDGREGGWRDNLNSDYEYLYEFITGKIKKEESQIEKFQRLYEKGYLIHKDGKDYVNIIVIKDEGKKWADGNDFAARLPGITDELKAIGDELDKEIYEIERNSFPAHMQKLLRMWTSNRLASNGMAVNVLEQLVESGVLREPTETQKKGLTTLMFCDTLPE